MQKPTVKRICAHTARNKNDVNLSIVSFQTHSSHLVVLGNPMTNLSFATMSHKTLTFFNDDTNETFWVWFLQHFETPCMQPGKHV